MSGILAAKREEVAWKLTSVRKAFETHVTPVLTDTRLAQSPEPAPTVTRSDVQMIAERIISDVAPTPDDLSTPPGYGHLALALIDAVYSIRSRYQAVQRVVAAYCDASGTACRSLTARAEPGFVEHGLDDFLQQAETSKA